MGSAGVAAGDLELAQAAVRQADPPDHRLRVTSSTEGSSAAAPILEVRGLGKRYGDQVTVAGVHLTVQRGEFITLLGPSGSGKTTMLNLIAGLVAPTTGHIVIDGVDATDLPPSRRGLGMVFQNYALMPHMTVFENVAFPLRVRRVPRSEIRRRVGEVLELVQPASLWHRKPRQLSGGQQQRAAIARCIVYSPAITLMDEPLGALGRSASHRLPRDHAESALGPVPAV